MDAGPGAKNRNGVDRGSSGSDIGCWEHDSEGEESFGTDGIEGFVEDVNCDTAGC
jgi:hypothetical protein